MTPADARAYCETLHERATQMGERTGEGLHLGRCLSVIRDLAAQVDGLTLEVTRLMDREAPKAATRKAKPGDTTPPRLDE